MSKRAIVLTVAGLAAAGAIAGVRYASRQPEVTMRDRAELEELGEGLGKLGKGVHRMGKGVNRMGKGLGRMGEGLSESFEDTTRRKR